MKRRPFAKLSLLATLATTLLISVPVFASPADEAAAIEAAKRWLSPLDAGQYSQGWDQAAPALRRTGNKGEFESQMKITRGSLGKLVSRKLKMRQYTNAMAGAPPGEYVVIRYDTVFEKKSGALETITTMKTGDGKWQVSGYYIK